MRRIFLRHRSRKQKQLSLKTKYIFNDAHLPSYLHSLA